MGGAGKVIRLLFALILSSIGLSVTAGATSKAQCNATKQKSIDQCVKEATARAANNNAVAKGVGNGCDGPNKENIPACASGYSGSGANNSINSAAIEAKCKKMQEQCDSACDESKAENKSEVSEISSAKKECKKKIDDVRQQAAAGQADGDTNKDGGKKQEDASNGGGAPMAAPPAPQSDDKKKDDPPDTAQKPKDDALKEGQPQSAKPALGSAQPQAALPDCGSSQAYMNDSCTKDLIAKCAQASNRSSGLCKSFQSRYCTKSGSAESSSDSLKAGSGMGSDFCQGTLAGQFCHDSRYPGRDKCPSCLKERGLPPSSTTDQATCGTDPMYSVPGALANKTNSSGGGIIGGSPGGGGGGSGAGGGSSAGGAQLTPESKATASAKDDGKPTGGMEVEGGGGGGGSAGGGSGSGSSSADSELKPMTLNGRALASIINGGVNAKDVENRYGPGIFKILGEVVRVRCASGKLLHCGPSK
jgi:hypothetical protein